MTSLLEKYDKARAVLNKYASEDSTVLVKNLGLENKGRIEIYDEYSPGEYSITSWEWNGNTFNLDEGMLPVHDLYFAWSYSDLEFPEWTYE